MVTRCEVPQAGWVVVLGGWGCNRDRELDRDCDCDCDCDCDWKCDWSWDCVCRAHDGGARLVAGGVWRMGRRPAPTGHIPAAHREAGVGVPSAPSGSLRGGAGGTPGPQRTHLLLGRAADSTHSVREEWVGALSFRAMTRLSTHRYGWMLRATWWTLRVRGNMYLVGGWDRATFLNDAWLLKPLVPHNIVCTATSPETPRTPQSQWDIGRLIRAEGGQVGPRFLTRILPRFHTRSLTRVLTRFVN
eukprot:1982196-Pyramimonas_sp.AAC.1